MSIKQVIVLRTKYPDGRGGTQGVRLGKNGAQIAHASMKVFFDRKEPELAMALRKRDGSHEQRKVLVIPITDEMAEWVNGRFTKIVVGVDTEEDLLRCHELALAAGLPTALIQDMGATEFHGQPTHTTCAIGPANSEEIDKITGPEGQVKCRLL